MSAGESTYKGYLIYRRSERRGAYNPWVVSGIKGASFATLRDAKVWIDGRVAKREDKQSEDRTNG